jgi:hypothetical protein
MTYEEIQKDKLAIKDQIGKPPATLTVGVWGFDEGIQVEELSTVISTLNIGGETGIYGNANFGIYGVSKYGGSAQTSFILGHSVAGVLGISTLGSNSSSPVITRVVNPNNTYREYFRDTTFKNTSNTTADWNTTTFKINFTSGSGTAESEIIALNLETYSFATLFLTGTSLSLITPSLSFDGGSNWEEVSNGVLYNSSYPSSSGIKYKLVSSGTSEVNSIRIVYG